MLLEANKYLASKKEIGKKGENIISKKKKKKKKIVSELH